MITRHVIALWFVVGVVPIGAQAPTPVTPIASLRLRAESWDWFDAGPEGRYTFVAAHARLGLTQQRALLAWRVELAAPVLFGLPIDAVLPAPSGALGLGGNYALANGGRRDVAGLFVKQAFVRLGRADGASRSNALVGRFEFADGGEYTPPDTALARIRQQRVNQRLLGTFGFTHGQRSFDGASVALRLPRGAVSATVVRPTAGVFDVDGAGSLPVDVAYLAWNAPVTVMSAPHDARVFAMYVGDHRGTVPTDARPGAVRASAPRHVGVTTIGGHWLGRRPLGPLQLDLVAWTALQFGRWGGLDHRANASAMELGVGAPSAWGAPAVRVGAMRGTGDANAADATHGTFYQALPTPRAYAPFPFYNMQNIQEAFVQLQVTPRRAIVVRASARVLQLDDAADLWYVGGGAYDHRTFGYAGRPSGGQTALGQAFDVSVDWQVSRRVAVSGYAATATGGRVTDAIYGGGQRGRLAFVETTLRR